LWENMKLKQVQVNVSSIGALRKKERAYNTITEQPTAHLKVARSLPPPINWACPKLTFFRHILTLESYNSFLVIGFYNPGILFRWPCITASSICTLA
jgi:hypothetical protein